MLDPERPAVAAPLTEAIEDGVAAAQHKSLLRFITCGSVDDGKSTLIGRLLYDSKVILSDQLHALEADSRRSGSQGENIDFALLVDGLAAEREQGITIDVAYRFFATGQRKFIVADTPGHEQYTRNMVTGASTADLAIILVDARKGLLTQTRRHSYLTQLLGIRHIVLAVNKMDLVGWDEGVFSAIVDGYRSFAETIGIEEFTAIPISGFKGDNVAAQSTQMPWYRGPTLIEHLEGVDVAADVARAKPFRMPVQWVNRPDLNFRGFAGLIASGSVRPGADVRVLPSGRLTRIDRIVTMDGDLDEAVAGQSVTLTFADEVDCARGDVIALAESPPEIADQFSATLVWMDDAALMPGRSYVMKLATQTVSATVRPPDHVIDVNTMARLAGDSLQLNDIGVVDIATDRPIVFAPFATSSELGGFILIDRATNATVAAGMIRHALRRGQNIHWQALDVTRAARAAIKDQQPRVLWFTGISGSGKSTIANLVEQKLHALGRHTHLIDGDNLRHGLNKDLGFSDADRIENVRRVGEVARLMTDAGLIVIAALISPFAAERDMVRLMMAENEFVEIYVDTPGYTAEQRDVKGLYARARSGEIPNFTGISSSYEPPIKPDIHVYTQTETAEAAAQRIVEHIIGVWSYAL